MALPPTYYDFVRKLRPTLVEMGEQDAAAARLASLGRSGRVSVTTALGRSCKAPTCGFSSAPAQGARISAGSG